MATTVGELAGGLKALWTLELGRHESLQSLRESAALSKSAMTDLVAKLRDVEVFTKDASRVVQQVTGQSWRGKTLLVMKSAVDARLTPAVTRGIVSESLIYGREAIEFYRLGQITLNGGVNWILASGAVVGIAILVGLSLHQILKTEA